MKKCNDNRARSTCILATISFFAGCLLLCSVAAGCGGGGGSETTYSSSSLYSNWLPVDEKLLEEPLLAEQTKTASTPDSGSLTNEKVAAKPTSAVAEKPTSAVVEKPTSVANQIFKASISNSGSGVHGFIVRFPAAAVATPGFNHFAYLISPYSETETSKQKLAMAKTFTKTPDTVTIKSQLNSCVEKLGTPLCTKGSRVAF